jgi:hypothetical protein
MSCLLGDGPTPVGSGSGRLDPSRQQGWVCPRIQERPHWGCSPYADPTGELGRCSVKAHHPDGVIVGEIRSADQAELAVDGPGMALDGVLEMDSAWLMSRWVSGGRHKPQHIDLPGG